MVWTQEETDLEFLLNSAVHVMHDPCAEGVSFGDEHPNFQYKDPWGSRTNDTVSTPSSVMRGPPAELEAQGLQVLGRSWVHCVFVCITGGFQIKVNVKEVSASVWIHFTQ